MSAKLWDKITINLQAYHKRTSDLLITVPIPPSNGFANQLKNVGVLDNQGVEISLNGYLLRTETLRWYSSLNLAYNQNKVIDLYDGDTLYLSNTLFPTYEEGKSVGLLYGLVKKKISTLDGFPIYLRKDGTEFNGQKEKARKEDYVVLGHTTPPFNGGWSHTFSFGNVSFSADFYYVLGGIAPYKNTSLIRSTGDAYKNGIKGQLKNTWFEPGDENKKYQNNDYSLGGYLHYNSRTYNTKNVGSTDYIRLTHLDVSYQFPKNILKNFSKKMQIPAVVITGLRIYAQARNIFTWSAFGGADPESGDLAGSVQPIMTLGLNLQF